MSLFSHAIMRGLALSLKFNDDYFHDKFNPTFPLLALWHYPPVPAESDSWGVGPHTDYGVLTILMQDDVGGLQVETNSGNWIDVTPIPGRNTDFFILKSHRLSPYRNDFIYPQGTYWRQCAYYGRLFLFDINF